jgi:ribosomal protein S18 acetylase RimI-like enzyme
VVAALQIRLGRLDEAGVIGALTQRVYSAGGWTDKGYDVELLDARARIEHAILLVAEQGRAVVGAVTIALPDTPFAEISRPDEAEIRMLAVDEDVRGARIACQLMDASEAYAREVGRAGVVLSTESSMHAAHRLYEHRGYTRETNRDWEVRGFMLLVYRRPL